MKKILLFSLIIAGIALQAQTTKNGKHTVSKDNPTRITIQETYFYGYFYFIQYKGMKGFSKFKNEDGTKHKIKNIGQLIDYMADRSYFMEDNIDQGGYSAFYGTKLTNNMYLFILKQE